MILITGGTGFVGKNLIRELLKESRRIRCLVRDPQRAEWLQKAGCELVRGDVTDPSSVLEAVGHGGVETVIHLVGILVETRGARFKDVHVEGTRNVVAACRGKGGGVKRYIHISALGTRENAVSEYHRTKWEAEEIVRASGLAYTIFRPSVMFGSEDKFTNVLARAIRLSPVIMVPGNGQGRMQPVSVKDVAAALAKSIGMAGASRRVFELGGAEVLTFDGVIDAVAEALARKRLKLHVPMPLMRVAAALMEAALPRPPLTRDALLMLEEDNVTGDNALPEVFGIQPAGLKEGVKEYLH
ncbi:MAG: complex I NDUFA9 subunit family protein [Thermodesulfobacteriota bacterium]